MLKFSLHPDSIKILLGEIFGSKLSYFYSGIGSIKRTLSKIVPVFKKQGRVEKAMIYWDQIWGFLGIKFLLR